MEPMSWIAIASLVGSLLTSGFSLFKQIKENQTTREFNADEAEKNREWQEEIYKKYESPLAQVLQRSQAGLNPYGNVTSQSVGTGSTASSGSSSLPGLSDPFSLLPSQMMQLKSYKIEQKQKEADLAKTEEETNSLILDNQMKALEAGNREEWINLQIQLMKADIETKRWSSEKIEAEASRAWDIATQSREFTESGGNEFEDSHQEAVARVNQIKSEINLSEKLNNANIAFINAQTTHEKEKAKKTIEDTLLSASQRLLNDLEYEHLTITYPLEEEMLIYAKSLGASEAQEAQIKSEITEAWSSPGWRDIGKLVLDFIHNNLNLSGGGNISKSYK